MSQSIARTSLGRTASAYVLLLGFALNAVAGFMVANSALWTWFVVAAGFLFIASTKTRNVFIVAFYPAIFLALIIAVWARAL